MSEVKGQVLGIVLVLMVFGIISSAITGVFTTLKDTVVTTSEGINEDLESYYPGE